MKLAQVIFLFLSCTLAACRVPPPGTPVGKAIACGTEAVQHNWPKIVGPVNTCLSGVDAPACLVDLVNPIVGITEDLIACVVRKEGAEFNAAAQANPSDSRSSRAATNARDFINQRGYTFTD